ncbi:DUF3618 domain-containing protein [Streptomyces lancefieldiae]|uniref:DUF3618 domain-containing protein n=1 Tax=Streptomyces lancefieldiae TaxID=3075520 RepID=A0ABU3AKJ5_9ACTN|nr:DUF3618 domain-containing protein [Streptomyces sp. DSM 40712]MDT0610701.1 DUF3618 domain-containing protein [Streptomyces sp. DSM 40712]
MTDARSGDGARTGSTAQPAGGAKGPDELRRQIEQTRSQLGDTVEELAGKADVKGRAKARAADLRDKAGAMTVQLRSSAAQAGHTAQDKASRAGHTVQHKAGRAGHTVQHKVSRDGHAAHDKAGRGGSTTEQRGPGRVRGAVRTGFGHPRAVLVVGAAAGAVVAVGVLRRRRHGRC